MKFQITWPKTWKTNRNIQSLKWKRFHKNKGHCHGLSMIAPLWRPANKIHLLEAPCPRSAIHPRMGWTPEFGQKESPQKALHSPTCKTKGPKERTKWKIQGFFQVSFVFFSFVVERNYSPLPQQLPQCFRDHSASFRDTHFTYNHSASFRDLVFLVLASATTVPLRFLSFWPCGPAFAFIFGLFHLLRSFVLGLDFVRASAGSTVVWACVPSAVLPRSFRAASAKHRSKTGN